MNGLGAGFAAKIFQNDLADELGTAGQAVLQWQAIAVQYDGIVVGESATGLLVGDGILFVRVCAEVQRIGRDL